MEFVADVLSEKNLENAFYPFHLTHVIYFLIVTYIGFVILNHFLRFRWFRWFYVSMVLITFASFFKHGNKKGEVKDILKLATV